MGRLVEYVNDMTTKPTTLTVSQSVSQSVNHKSVSARDETRSRTQRDKLDRIEYVCTYFFIL